VAAPRELPSWAPRAGVAVALAGLVAWSFVQRWSVLSASPFPLGVDGYFYPIQLRSLLESGELQYPASPLTFWLMLPFAAATDPITGAKLGAALFGALIALPAYAVGAQLGRDGEDRGRGAGLVAATIATTSAGSMYLTIEFVKNGIGLTVALTALWLVLRAFEAPRRGRVIAAIAGIVAALLAHKMAAAIVIGIAVPAAIMEAHRRGSLRWRKALPIGVGLGIAAVLLVAGMIMPQRFLSPADLALLDGLFTSDADWSLPVHRAKLTLDHEPVLCAIVGLLAAAALIIDARGKRGWLLLVATILQVSGAIIVVGAAIVRGGAIVGVIGVLAVVGGSLLRRRASKIAGASLRNQPGAGRVTAAWCVLALAAIIALPWLDTSSSQGLAMRMRIVAFVPLALAAAIVVRIVARYLARWLPQRSVIGGVVVLVLVAIQASGGSRTEGLIEAHPALVASAQAANGKLPPDGVAVVLERHIAYMLAWYARTPISMRPEPIAEERRYRVMPLNLIGVGSPLDAQLIEVRTRGLRVIGLHPLHPNGLVMVPEATWRDVLSRLPPGDRERFERWPTI
jgi:hypothetical protein